MMELWPFTNFHDLNLDWIIKKIRNVEDSEAAAKASEEAAADSASAAAGSMGMALLYRNAAKNYRDEAQGFANDAENSATGAESYFSFMTPERAGAVDNQGNIDITAFKNMLIQASTDKIPVKFTNDYVFEFITGSTVADPTVIKLSNLNGLYIDGQGHSVYMKGCSKAYIDAIDDISSSGRDIFTFLSFHNCSNIHVSNMDIYGDNGTGDQVFRFRSPRAIGIGFKGSDNCTVTNVHGSKIFGNTVNATTADDLTTGCSYIRVENCSAEHCLENGFNFMGETKFSTLTNCVSRNNYTGFEIAGEGCIIENCAAEYNYEVGIVLSGGTVSNTIIGNTRGRTASDSASGTGVRITTALSPTIVEDCVIENNYGFSLYIYPGVTGSVIKNNTFRNNTLTHSWGISWYLVGTSENEIEDITITNNVFETTRTTGRVLQGTYTDGLIVKDNIIRYNTPTNVLYLTGQGNDHFVFANNVLPNAVVVTDTTDRTYYIGDNIINYALA